MKTIRTLLVALAVCATAGIAAAAETARDLTWDDLLPPEAAYPEDPTEHLNDAQRADLGFVFRARMIKAQGVLPDDSPILQAMEERTQRLKSTGVDLERMIDLIRAAEEEIRKADEMIVEELDGRRIRMPGYVLPLEFSGKNITEFLLVPFVGACVHVPPPPPNQIVYVRMKSGGFEGAGLFTPVYVTGLMSAKGVSSKSVFIVDGTMDIDIGYTLDGEQVQKMVVD
jgi:hypothetical protein